MSLFSVCALITAIWLLVPPLTEYLGIGTATAQARITAAEDYEYFEKSGRHGTTTRSTGNHYTMQFEYYGQQIDQSLQMRHYNYRIGKQVEVVFTKSPPHRIVRVNGKWWPQSQIVPGFMLLIAAAVLWAARNGIQRATRKSSL